MRFVPPPPRRSAAAVYATLSAQFAAMAALVTFEAVRGRRLAEEIATLDGDPHSPGAQAVAGAATVFAVLLLLAAAATFAVALAYAVWLVRAAQANDPKTRVAGRVIAGWLIPGVNLVAPPLIVDHLWRGADPPPGRRARWLTLLTAWWLCSAAAFTLVVLRLPLTGPVTRGPSPQLTGFGPAELTAVALAALLCAATVREITRHQTFRTHPHRARPGTTTPRPIAFTTGK
ncbi:hypothetical protein Misp01_59120 [Microtetraspora sp. NBRC 13810]|uniref:DUF4328 domain-containing protein n=1 Tax=Microtetraspora sp. NBRC 13810 TaxID=3030990 RepID=UPI0024A4D6F3|nr:DUF4328 domain-containing protein [Microtetraspora sp. NBRC 13810]GLW10784.1 hypothetical protein Misp01_59120 [Microtetraspora sp. NBRC 13810]